MNIRQSRKIVRAVNDARMMVAPLRHRHGTASAAWEKIFRPHTPWWNFADWWHDAINGCANLRCWHCERKISVRYDQHFCSQKCSDRWMPF